MTASIIEKEKKVDELQVVNQQLKDQIGLMENLLKRRPDLPNVMNIVVNTDYSLRFYNMRFYSLAWYPLTRDDIKKGNYLWLLTEFTTCYSEKKVMNSGFIFYIEHISVK